MSITPKSEEGLCVSGGRMASQRKGRRGGGRRRPGGGGGGGGSVAELVGEVRQAMAGRGAPRGVLGLLDQRLSATFLLPEREVRVAYDEPCVYREYNWGRGQVVRAPPPQSPLPFPLADPSTDILEAPEEKKVVLHRCNGCHNVNKSLHGRVRTTSSRTGKERWTYKMSAIERYQPLGECSEEDEKAGGLLGLPTGQGARPSKSAVECFAGESRVRQLATFWDEKFREDGERGKKREAAEERPRPKKKAKPEPAAKKRPQPVKARPVPGPPPATKRAPRRPGNPRPAPRGKALAGSRTVEQLLLVDGADMGSLEDLKLLSSVEPATCVSEVPREDPQEVPGVVYKASIRPIVTAENDLVFEVKTEETDPLKRVSIEDIISALERVQQMLGDCPDDLLQENLPVPEAIKAQLMGLVSSRKTKPKNEEKGRLTCLDFPWEKRLFKSPTSGKIIGYTKKRTWIHVVKYVKVPYHARLTRVAHRVDFASRVYLDSPPSLTDLSIGFGDAPKTPSLVFLYSLFRMPNIICNYMLVDTRFPESPIKGQDATEDGEKCFEELIYQPEYIVQSIRFLEKLSEVKTRRKRRKYGITSKKIEDDLSNTEGGGGDTPADPENSVLRREYLVKCYETQGTDRDKKLWHCHKSPKISITCSPAKHTISISKKVKTYRTKSVKNESKGDDGDVYGGKVTTLDSLRDCFDKFPNDSQTTWAVPIILTISVFLFCKFLNVASLAINYFSQ